MRYSLPLLSLLLISFTAVAQDTLKPPAQRTNLHFQTTYVYQYSARFHSPYEGPNSLSSDEERQNSLTATLYFGARLWKGAEVYINPEIAGGSGLTGARGMGGSTNGETFRVGDPSPSLYLGRAFLTQTFSLGRASDLQEDDANALQLYQPKDHLRFIIGKYCLGDLFDNNEFANSPRTQFLNWSLMNNGAWDYAANVRGYTLAFTTEIAWHGTGFKIALAALPKEANGPDLETNLGKAISLNAELSRTYKIRDHDGNVRLLGYYNRTHMGNYRETLLPPNPYPVNIISTEEDGRTKTGLGLNADQEISDQLGISGRFGWNDGKNETWCFTEIDRTLTLGLSLKGTGWKRPDDVAGIALAVNGLSKDHRDYLAAGGNGFILGDGRLNYGHETILEAYYNFKPVKAGLWFSLDNQLCLNPGYNRDRGPADVISLRFHAEL